MLDRPDVKRIDLDRVSRLPWVAPPAGYIILIQDVAYGSRYKIARHQQLDRHLIRCGADFPFDTRVARIWQADDAAAAERELHDEIAAGTAIGEWFDLYQFPKASYAHASQYESVSLRDLAQHSGDAESLLQDAKIVGAGGPAATTQAPAGSPESRPQTPAPGIQRAARTRGPRRLRWAFVLGLFILAGFFVAERSSDMRRAIDSILDPSSRPAISNRAAPTTVAGESGTGSALPTPKVEGRGEVFYAKSRANARACARLSCKVLTVLSPNAQFVAQRYVEGQRVNGSDRWIVFRFRGQDAHIHSSVVSRVRRISEPLPEQSPTARPTRVPATVEGQDEVFYVAADIQARVCARWSCAAAGLLPLGARITALNYSSGQTINGSDRWIRFYRDGRHVYVHSGHLTRTQPKFATSPTAQAQDQQGAVTASGVIYFLKTRARARECTRLDCDVADVFEKGAKIVAAAGYLLGERINNNGRWIAFRHNGQDLYLHSDLLTKEPPTLNATPQPTSTTHRIAAKPTAEGENEIFYVNTEARARTCARLTCSEAQLLRPGMRIIALRYTQGAEIDGSDRWIRFINRGWIQYVHSSFLSRDKPMADSSAEASATVPPLLAPEYDEDELFYVKPGVIADVRTCMRLACHRVARLKSGAEIMPILVVNGQNINGNAKWVMFDMGSHRRFAHTGDLTQIKPSPEATAEPSPTSQTASIQTIKYEKNQYYYVRSRVKASVRSCANPNCDEVGVLLPGMHVWAVEVVRGPAVSGSSEWIQFDYRGRHRYIHSRFLSPQHAQVNAEGNASRPAQSTATEPPPTATEPPPTATEPPPTATEPPPTATDPPPTATDPPPTVTAPPPTATVAPAANYVVETAGNVNANVRSCPRTSCEIVAKYGPGTKVEALGSVTGETVYETDIWLEIRLDGGSAFIHSELVAEAG